jgi:hypothetical protein
MRAHVAVYVIRIRDKEHDPNIQKPFALAFVLPRARIHRGGATVHDVDAALRRRDMNNLATPSTEIQKVDFRGGTNGKRTWGGRRSFDLLPHTHPALNTRRMRP